MPDKIREGFEFSYESMAASSFLAVKAGPRENILDYQVAMAAANNIERLACFNMKCLNGEAYCYYNITSKLSLSFFLKRRKLSREEFIKLLADITRTVISSEGYLLSEASFLIDAEYIFINPENLEISLVYIPVETGEDPCRIFRDFVIRLILKQADIEEKESDNFLQRILSNVKTEVFNFPDFLRLLDDLLYGGGAVSTATEETAASWEPSSTESQTEPVIDNKKPNVRPVAIALLSQTAMAAAVLLSVRYIRDAGGNSAANYAAVAIIAAAVDIIILKYVMKGLKTVKSGGGPSFVNETGKAQQPDDAGQNPEPVVEFMPSTNNNTVLLGNEKTGIPVLKSKNSASHNDIAIDKPDFLIGRLKEQVDHMCESTAIGKVHAQVIRRNGGCYLKDLNSVNGTFVNEGRLASNVEYELKDGDHVSFANTDFILVMK